MRTIRVLTCYEDMKSSDIRAINTPPVVSDHILALAGLLLELSKKESDIGTKRSFMIYPHDNL